MKKRLHQIALMAGIAAMLAGSTSWAWGPRADVALVTMAGRFIAKGGAVPLTKLEKDIQYGASVTRAEMARLIPGAESSPVQAIESEMYLLRAVRGTRVDPYYAFRLGVLGKLVARLSSPLADAPVTYRNMYYADVDSNIDVQLVPSRRRVVDPDTFLKQLLTDTKSRESLILQDYQSGVGFGGVASRTLTDDASRSANAIADVWYTLFQGSVIVANVPETRVRDYYIEAIGFYIQRDNESESRNAYDQLMELDVRTPDMLKRIGDMYYDAGEYALAMKEYEAVLSIEPARRDVVERIADYYVQVSDEARKEGQLEDSRAALVRAIDVFQLHPTAQGKLFEVEKLIEERDARLEAARAALLEAHQFEGRAKQQVTPPEFRGRRRTAPPGGERVLAGGHRVPAGKPGSAFGPEPNHGSDDPAAGQLGGQRGLAQRGRQHDQFLRPGFRDGPRDGPGGASSHHAQSVSLRARHVGIGIERAVGAKPAVRRHTRHATGSLLDRGRRPCLAEARRERHSVGAVHLPAEQCAS